MQPQLRILHLEDDPNDSALVQSTLKEGGFTCSTIRVQTEEAFVAALENGGVDLILSDYTLPEFDGLSAMEIARTKCPDVPLIFVSGTLGEERSIVALKSGATDYVLKEGLARLVPAVRRVMLEVEALSERRRTQEQIADQAALLDEAQDAIMVRDLAGTIIFWNKGAERIYGWSRQEVIGRDVGEFLTADVKTFAEATALTIKHGKWSGERQHHTKDQHEIAIEAEDRSTVFAGTADGKHRHAGRRHRARPQQHPRADHDVHRHSQDHVGEPAGHENPGND
jgi:PAS domain S-box-containing protein